MESKGVSGSLRIPWSGAKAVYTFSRFMYNRQATCRCQNLPRLAEVFQVRTKIHLYQKIKQAHSSELHLAIQLWTKLLMMWLSRKDNRRESWAQPCGTTIHSTSLNRRNREISISSTWALKSVRKEGMSRKKLLVLYLQFHLKASEEGKHLDSAWIAILMRN